MHLSFYHQIDPIPEARHFIRRIIFCDCPEPISVTVPGPPTGYNHIGWAMRGAGSKVTEKGLLPVPEGTVHFAGQTVRTPASISLNGRIRHILAELTPVALYSGFGIYADQLANDIASARFLGHGGIQDRLDKVPKHGSMDEALETFQRALVEAFVGLLVPTYVTRAAREIEQSVGLSQVGALTDAVSSRQLLRGFNRIVGCTPKYFSQVLRVNATLLDLAENPTRSLAMISADNGFADQSHMVRSIRTYFGKAPSDIRGVSDAPIRVFPTANNG